MVSETNLRINIWAKVLWPRRDLQKAQNKRSGWIIFTSTMLYTGNCCKSHRVHCLFSLLFHFLWEISVMIYWSHCRFMLHFKAATWYYNSWDVFYVNIWLYLHGDASRMERREGRWLQTIIDNWYKSLRAKFRISFKSSYMPREPEKTYTVARDKYKIKTSC